MAGLLLTVVVVLASEGTAFGQTASLDGKWTATALTVAWNVGDWGAACGPKPSGGGEPGGTATVAQNGNELVISGVGRTYRTTECWEQFPGLSRTGHTAATRSWRTSCKSPASDPRQAKIVTSVTATDDQIIFDETGAYQFVIRGQNCTASVRRSRFFRRIKTAGAAASSAATTSTAAPARGTPAKEPTCVTLGPAARIELRPSRKLMRPGESFTFRASVVDAKGCQLGIAPAFRLPESATGVTLSGSGTVTVAKDAPEADVKLTAAVGGRAVESELLIVSGERFDALLAGGGFDETGASAEAAVTRLESGSVGARSTVIEDDSGRRRTLFVGVVGGAAVLLGIMGLVLVRRSRRAPPSTRSAPSAAPPAAAQPVRPGTFCPTCREEYAPEAQFCPTDGNRLVPLQQAPHPLSAGSVCPVCGQGFDPGVTVCPKHDEPLVPPAVYAARNAPAPIVIRKICPVCGTQYGGESQFCGQCGASLVPVN